VGPPLARREERLVRIPRALLHVELDDLSTLGIGDAARLAVRSLLADILGIAENRLRVIAPEVGGGFGCKGDAYPEDPLVAALAIMTGKPVKWIATRSEAMMSTTHGRDQVATVELGARQDGTITALKLHIVGVLVLVGLTYFPALALGPFAEGLH